MRVPWLEVVNALAAGRAQTRAVLVTDRIERQGEDNGVAQNRRQIGEVAIEHRQLVVVRVDLVEEQLGQ
jgi:hypothetical protein